MSPADSRRPSATVLAMMHPLRTSRALSFAVFAAVAVTLLLFFRPSVLYSVTKRPFSDDTSPNPPARRPNLGAINTNLITDTVEYFVDFPIRPPYKDHFGAVGRRCAILRDWLELFDASPDETLRLAIEETALSLFTYLHRPPGNPGSRTSIADLRARIQRGTAGVVIPTGLKTLRFSAHLIVCLRKVLNSKLPIQITYAGDTDLPPSSRQQLASLLPEASPPLTFLDITTVFDECTVQLRSGGWAIKAFAALASPFEQTILLDADAVFLQPPEALLRSAAFTRTGALLFHDRLLWQHAFRDRHEWWRSQIRRPSPALNASRVWNEDYAEEGDSGVVVVDKSRTDVLVGLLHVAWQNMYDVREEVTYKLTYGDKESWWLGFELAGSQYEFEKHYGSILGWEEKDEETGASKVCSFVIAHVDEEDLLIWYNGSLLKNKQLPDMKHEYEVPNKWMLEDTLATWVKGERKEDMSCMINGPVRSLTAQEIAVLESSISKAKEIDKILMVI